MRDCVEATMLPQRGLTMKSRTLKPTPGSSTSKTGGRNKIHQSHPHMIPLQFPSIPSIEVNARPPRILQAARSLQW